MKKTFIFLIFTVFLTLQTYTQNRPMQQTIPRSKEPMKIMGFTSKTTIAQIKKQFDDQNISYKPTMSNNGIQITNITWEGIRFDYINVLTDNNGYLSEITAYPLDNQNLDKLYTSFTKIVSDLPFYKKYESYAYNTQFTSYIYNGKTVGETAVFEMSYLELIQVTNVYFRFFFKNTPNNYR